MATDPKEQRARDLIASIGASVPPPPLNPPEPADTATPAENAEKAPPSGDLADPPSSPTEPAADGRRQARTGPTVPKSADRARRAPKTVERPPAGPPVVSTHLNLSLPMEVRDALRSAARNEHRSAGRIVVDAVRSEAAALESERAADEQVVAVAGVDPLPRQRRRVGATFVPQQLLVPAETAGQLRDLAARLDMSLSELVTVVTQRHLGGRSGQAAGGQYGNQGDTSGSAGTPS